MSLRKAVNAKCRECIYDPNSGQGTWRKQVEDCTSPLCPLFPYRPVTIQNSTKNDQSSVVKAEVLPVD